mmetsp:Transcript_7086/g.21649  ORF Transcript_7086/g.21649 Transcript_7086/m.21649 type:complete len:253 (+) Transcript_7086:94-852(+)
MAATRSPASDSEIGTTQGSVCCVPSSSIVTFAASSFLPSAASTSSYSPSASCRSPSFCLAPIGTFSGGHHIQSLKEFEAAGFITFTLDMEDAGEAEDKRNLWKAKISVGVRVGDAVECLGPFEAVDISKAAARDRASEEAVNSLRGESMACDTPAFASFFFFFFFFCLKSCTGRQRFRTSGVSCRCRSHAEPGLGLEAFGVKASCVPRLGGDRSASLSDRHHHLPVLRFVDDRHCFGNLSRRRCRCACDHCL